MDWRTPAVLALFCLAQAHGVASCAAQPAPEMERAVPDLGRGVTALLRDLDNHFWDSGRQRIRPTNGCNSGQPGCRGAKGGIGEPNDDLANLSFWEMAQYANVQYWTYKAQRRAGDAAAAVTRARIKAQWRTIRSRWSDVDLSSAAPSTGIMNVSDDAFWAFNYLLQVHDVLGDRTALDDAVALLPNILDRWADPNAGRIDYGGGLRSSTHGILYAERTGDPGHQGVSAIFEAMMAAGAASLYRQTGAGNMLAFAEDAFERTRRYFRKTCANTSGACTTDPDVYYTELDIKPCTSGGALPCAKGDSNPHFLKPVFDSFGPPQRGCDATYLAGTMAMAVLAVRLFDATGQDIYLAEARSAAASIVRRDTYLRAGNLIGNFRDPWTDGYWAPAFVEEVLTRPGLDPGGAVGLAIRNTATAIVAQRTPDGFYGGDWTPAEPNGCNSSTTWLAQSAALSGSGGGQAKPSQIMTNATSASMAQAGAMMDILIRPR